MHNMQRIAGKCVKCKKHNHFPPKKMYKILTWGFHQESFVHPNTKPPFLTLSGQTRKPANPQQHANAAAATPAVPGDATGTEVKSALPGAVLRVSVKAGDHVAKDDELLVLDVMKMETPVRADKAGIVTAIRVAVGEKVNTGDLLALIA